MPNYDQRHQQVDRQYNAGGNINLYGQRELSTQELFRRGMDALQDKRYKDAIKDLEQIITKGAGSSEVYYYLAFAMLPCGDLRLLKHGKAKKIEENLQKAIKLDPTSGQAHALWALLKEGYYKASNMFDHPPKIKELLERNWLIEQEQISEILYHLNVSNSEVWEKITYDKIKH